MIETITQLARVKVQKIGDQDSDISDSTTTIINNVILVLGLACVAAMVVGGINYITAAGDTAKTEKGKKTITYGLVGLIVSALSFTIVNYAISDVLKIEADTSQTETSQNKTEQKESEKKQQQNTTTSNDNTTSNSGANDKQSNTNSAAIFNHLANRASRGFSQATNYLRTNASRVPNYFNTSFSTALNNLTPQRNDMMSTRNATVQNTPGNPGYNNNAMTPTGNTTTKTRPGGSPFYNNSSNQSENPLPTTPIIENATPYSSNRNLFQQITPR